MVNQTSMPWSRANMSSQSCTQRRKTQQRENEVQSFQGSSTPEQKIGDSPLELSEELDQEEMAQEDIANRQDAPYNRVLEEGHDPED
jgi:hypothetical protein